MAIAVRSAGRECPSREAAGPWLPISAIAIANNIVGDSLPAASLRQLSSYPFSCRVCRHPQPHNLDAMVSQDQEAIEQPEGECRHDEQVHRRDAISMIAKKGRPAL